MTSLRNDDGVIPGWRGPHGPLLIAEIGGNHEGDFEYAKDLTQAAIESGADVVKFQVYYADDLVNPNESPDRHEHFKRFELDPEQHYQELLRKSTLHPSKAQIVRLPVVLFCFVLYCIVLYFGIRMDAQCE